MNITLRFYIRYHTKYGERLWLTLKNQDTTDESQSIPLEYLSTEFWQATIQLPKKELEKNGLAYFYTLETKEGKQKKDGEKNRSITLLKSVSELIIHDTWNYSGEFENAFLTAPFQEVLLPKSKKTSSIKSKKGFHLFKVKAPLLEKNEMLCMAGSDEALANWSEKNPLLMQREDDWWQVAVDLQKANFPVRYKYGIYNSKEKKFVRYEDGENRISLIPPTESQQHIVHDGFIHTANTNWRGAGVSIPVFSLRTKKSFGVGEFEDLKLLVDWSKYLGMKLIQLLPVNDTIATNTWTDSYPYAAISAFALHPLYINLSLVADKKQEGILKNVKHKQKQLNELEKIDYEEVMQFKMALLKEIFESSGEEHLEEKEFKSFFKENQHWLKPYAIFSFFRNKYNTVEFDHWKDDAVYDAQRYEGNWEKEHHPEISFYYFIQYHLHKQLRSSVDYAHEHGIVIKGDIPIGVYRWGVDAWVEPELYNMHEQAGAPPDDFAVIGQNWGFPTYNWKQMQEDGFAWWKKRFAQMSHYFDAFRIDHILGFFRIWSIPIDAVQGIMGHFVPAIPVHFVEFRQNGIEFDENRFCKPFITDQILQEIFGDKAEEVRKQFIQENDFGTLQLKPEFDTQEKINLHFEKKAADEKIKSGLYDLVSNVILFKEKGSNGQAFHFRIGMEKTLSFKYLIPHVQEKLKALYSNYFYKRQDDFWEQEAMNKLPYLKEATNMLICGEDLGMVPHCVPDVMRDLGILSLEIQRMPKDPNKEFFRPAESPYLSVITPSTHDMSTIRGWWEENRAITQKFYNYELGQWGDAPVYCEPWINHMIIQQHLHAPAMWSVFQIQDLLGISGTLRRENPAEERINVPANPKHYWQYRMHITLEDLLKEKEFNQQVHSMIEAAGRN